MGPHHSVADISPAAQLSAPHHSPRLRPGEDRIMATPDERGAALHLLVVIDHQEARIYRTEVHGAVPERIAPYDPHGYGRHLHSAHEWTDGKRPPERKSYYEAVAKTLRGADQVLLFGSGTGRSTDGR